MIFTLEELRAAHVVVLTQMQPTAQHVWPLISQAVGTRVVVKHENHTPTGAFKVRGGITFIDWLRKTHPDAKGIITATRGNHGQSQARAAIAAGLTAKIIVPEGNSPEKNAAMRSFGAQVITFGKDFDAARAQAMRLAELENLFPVPPFHRELMRGVATYGLELFTEHPDLDVVYVPIGCGSGICGTIAARDALGLDCEIVAVVSDNAQCAKLSVDAGRLVETKSAETIADGMAVRIPVEEAFEIYSKGAARFVSVSDAEITDAMRLYFKAIHTVAEGAGAAGLAAALKDRDAIKGKKVGVILSGGNVDTDQYQHILAKNGPNPR